MALTNTQLAPIDGLKHITAVIVNVACDTSYPTGGYSFDANSYGFVNVFYVGIDGENGYNAQYDYTNKKLKFYSAAGTEVTNATNLSALSAIRVVILGT